MFSLTEKNLKNKVKCVKEKTFTLEGDLNDFKQLREDRGAFDQYNERGMLVHSEEYDIYGTRDSLSRFEYNDNNKITRESYTDETTFYEYDSQGNLLQTQYQEGSDQLQLASKLYYEDSKRIKEERFDNGVISNILEFSYPDNRTKEIRFLRKEGSDFIETMKSISIFDEKEQLIELSTYFSSYEGCYEKNIYEYNKNGMEIKNSTLKKGVLSSVTETHYNGNQIIEVIYKSLSNKGELEVSGQNVYNDKNDTVKYIHHPLNNREGYEEIYHYTYDRYDNWNSKIRTRQGKANFQWLREIEYWSF